MLVLAYPKSWFDRLGLVSLLDNLNSASRLLHLTAGCGTARPVVWEDGGGDPASYPIPTAFSILVPAKRPLRRGVSGVATQHTKYPALDRDLRKGNVDWFHLCI